MLIGETVGPYRVLAKLGEGRNGRGVVLGTVGYMSLWRQLPAGTVGAYRLMANLLSLH